MDNGINIKRKDEQGVALILALLFVVLLSAIVVGLGYEMQVEASFVAANMSDFEAYLAAKSAVAFGMSLLVADIEGNDLTSGSQGMQNTQGMRNSSQGFQPSGSQNSQNQPMDNDINVDSLNDLWAEDVTPVSINDAKMIWSVSDEYGKLNLNALISPETGEENVVLVRALEALFTTRGVEGEPVQAILDWLDEDGGTDAGGDAYEFDYYSSLEIPFGCKDNKMDSIEELLLIPGITPEVYFGQMEVEKEDLTDNAEMAEEFGKPLTELLTVHGHPQGLININTVNFEILQLICEQLQEESAEADGTGFLNSVYDKRVGESQQEGSVGVIDEQELQTLMEQSAIPSGMPNSSRGRQTGVNDPNVKKKQPQNTRTNNKGGSQRDDDVAEFIPGVGFITFGDRYRIRGDGISTETRARIEAYVYRDREMQFNETLFIIDWRMIR